MKTVKEIRQIKEKIASNFTATGLKKDKILFTDVIEFFKDDNISLSQIKKCFLLIGVRHSKDKNGSYFHGLTSKVLKPYKPNARVLETIEKVLLELRDARGDNKVHFSTVKIATRLTNIKNSDIIKVCKKLGLRNRRNVVTFRKKL